MTLDLASDRPSAFVAVRLCDVAPEDARIGLAVEAFYVEFDAGLVLHQFRPVGAS